jgi:hypothetical protein
MKKTLVGPPSPRAPQIGRRGLIVIQQPVSSSAIQIGPTARNRVVAILLAIIACVTGVIVPVSAELVFDNGFEGGTAAWKAVPANISLSDVSREGSNSICFLPVADGRRSELTIMDGLGDYAWGTEYWVGFSLQVIKPNQGFGIICQHHSTPGVVSGGVDWDHSSGENSFTIQAKNGKLDVRTATIPANVNGTTIGSRTNAQSGAATWGTAVAGIPYVTNRWYDFILHFRLSPDTNGIMEVWVKDTVTGMTNKLFDVTNGVTVYRYDSGKSASASKAGDPDRSGLPKTPANFQKIGLYYGTGSADRGGEVLYDAFRIWKGPGGSYETVAPRGGGLPRRSSSSENASGQGAK